VGTSVIAIVVESIKNATFLDFMKALGQEFFTYIIPHALVMGENILSIFLK